MLDTDALSDQQVVAKTGWGEERGLGSIGMQAAINTGQNRLASGIHWWGNSLRTIFLHPDQYSCWLVGDPNRPKLMAVTESDKWYALALDIAADALAGSLPDIVRGADSYYTLGSLVPKWAAGLTPVATIKSQLFFRTIKGSPIAPPLSGA